jgi:ribosomal protein L35AE/L33A
MDKQFTVAGVSTHNGVVKYRFANSLERDKVLRKSGHTDIKLIELPNAMSKEDAVSYINQHTDFVAVVKPTVKSKIEPKAQREPKAKNTKAA